MLDALNAGHDDWVKDRPPLPFCSPISCGASSTRPRMASQTFKPADLDDRAEVGRLAEAIQDVTG
jgi:hypothetical protein